ncbi:hypothetical protein [Paenibacillus sp. RC67]|uniref:hypothetical protein n=1 Tax=Paenibacillus sp. RC67 TaxID=3039392 RepID=UPI0024ACE5A2|nr:hypothetical protein [Paenibacillus sp. RC67]
MNTTTRHLFLGLFFSILTGIGLWILETIEGSKITTSLYIDVSYITVTFGSFLAFPFYFISFFVLGLLVDKFLNSNVFTKLFGYAGLGGICGFGIFKKYYGEFFVREYGLNIETSILVFTCIGLILAFLDKFVKEKVQK